MKALISLPRVHQPAAGTVALTYEMKLEGFIEPFEVFLIETPDGEIPPLNLADHIPDHQVILAGGERIMIFPWHIDHTNPAGHYRMEFRAAGHSFYPEPFQVVAYSWGVLSDSTDLMQGLTLMGMENPYGYGWYLGGRTDDVIHPDRLWIRKDFGSRLCTALERTYWAHYYDEEIKITEFSGPGGAELDHHPPGGHKDGKAADIAYLLMEPGNLNSVDWRWFVKFVCNFADLWPDIFDVLINPTFHLEFQNEVNIMHSLCEITDAQRTVLLQRVQTYSGHIDHFHLQVPRV